MADRNDKGQFTKGNTCGKRKRIPKDFTEAVRLYSDEALQALVDIIKNQREKADVRLKACIYIIDRAYGKPVEPTTVVDNDPVLALLTRWDEASERIDE